MWNLFIVAAGLALAAPPPSSPPSLAGLADAVERQAARTPPVASASDRAQFAIDLTRARASEGLPPYLYNLTVHRLVQWVLEAEPAITPSALGDHPQCAAAQHFIDAEFAAAEIVDSWAPGAGSTLRMAAQRWLSAPCEAIVAADPGPLQPEALDRHDLARIREHAWATAPNACNCGGWTSTPRTTQYGVACFPDAGFDVMNCGGCIFGSKVPSCPESCAPLQLASGLRGSEPLHWAYAWREPESTPRGRRSVPGDARVEVLYSSDVPPWVIESDLRARILPCSREVTVPVVLEYLAGRWIHLAADGPTELPTDATSPFACWTDGLKEVTPAPWTHLRISPGF
jgi:hypothetical protein